MVHRSQYFNQMTTNISIQQCPVTTAIEVTDSLSCDSAEKPLGNPLKARLLSSQSIHSKPQVCLAGESVASFEKTHAVIGLSIARAGVRNGEFWLFCELWDDARENGDQTWWLNVQSLYFASQEKKNAKISRNAKLNKYFFLAVDHPVEISKT